MLPLLCVFLFVLEVWSERDALVLALSHALGTVWVGGLQGSLKSEICSSQRTAELRATVLVRLPWTHSHGSPRQAGLLSCRAGAWVTGSGSRL